MFKIGNIELKNKVVLAPMAGITDQPFRRIVRHFHSGLVVGEMVSATAYHYNSGKTHQLMLVNKDEAPISMQIFGCRPQIMAEAAVELEQLGADIVDINMGCPVPKVVKNGEGSALMRDLPLAGEIIRAVADSVRIPVTVKMRLGWDDSSITAPELAELAEANGAAAVTVHARTREQFYHGEADWSKLKAVRERISIPLIGNGDVASAQSAIQMMQETGCDAVMVGRACMGAPWIFRQISEYLENGQIVAEPSLTEKFQIIEEHLKLQVEFFGEQRGIKQMRKQLAWYFKGLPHAAAMRDLVNALTGLDEALRLLHEYYETLMAK